MIQYTMFAPMTESDQRQLMVGSSFGPSIYRKVSDLAFIPQELKDLSGADVFVPESVVFDTHDSLRFYRRNWNKCMTPEPALKQVWAFGNVKLNFGEAVKNPFLHYTHNTYEEICKTLESFCLSDGDKDMVLYQDFNYRKNGEWNVTVYDDELGCGNALRFSYC